jgi:hypothetical protein
MISDAGGWEEIKTLLYQQHEYPPLRKPRKDGAASVSYDAKEIKISQRWASPPLAFATLSYYCVEKPMLRLRDKKLK